MTIGTGSSNVDTSAAAGDYFYADGATYSSQAAADNAQDANQDAYDDTTGINQDAGNDGYDNSGSQTAVGYDNGPGFDITGGDLGPVVLDLNGQGIKITPKSASNMFFDMAGDGYQHHTAWAGAGNGVLVLDTQGNGQITQQNQVVFTDWDPTATTDMQALLDVFDTNHDGKLDSGDKDFAEFKIMFTNPDESTTLETLAQAGISSINLTSDKTMQVFTDGSSINGETAYTKTNGATGTAATVIFAFDTAGYWSIRPRPRTQMHRRRSIIRLSTRTEALPPTSPITNRSMPLGRDHDRT